MKRIAFMLLLLIVVAPAVTHAANENMPNITVMKASYTSGDDNVTIPQFSGMLDSEKQVFINNQLKDKIFSLRNPEPESSLHGDFAIVFATSRLISIRFQGDSYTKLAVHPTKIDTGIHVDVQTGRIYDLADLFIKGTGYISVLQGLCLERKNAYRLQIAGLWDGWEHETFERSWQGQDAAFLLSHDSVRLYSIPAYATGTISGYRVPYIDFLEYIDQSGPLWQAIQDRTPIQMKLPH